MGVCLNLVHGECDDVQLVLEGGTMEDGVRVAIFNAHTVFKPLEKSLHNSARNICMHISIIIILKACMLSV